MNISKKEKQIRDWHKKYVLGVGSPELDVIFDSGEGVIVKDINGREYLDFLSQTWNVLVGHKCKRVIDAAIDQMNKISFCSYLAMTEPRSKFAKLMYDITDKSLKKIYTISGGSEANESAIKLARIARSKSGGYKVMSYLGAYHGCTYGALSWTQLTEVKSASICRDITGTVHVGMPYCYRCLWGQKYPNCDFECAKNIEAYLIQEGPDNFAAIIIEPVISAFGTVIPPKGYMKRVRDITKKYGVVLVFDEVVTGFGRTGKMFGYEHYDVVPDIITLGKGISSGYSPFAAMMVNEELGNIGYEPYFHGFTMSGYPLGNAVAYANVKTIIDDNLVDNSKKVGKYFLDRLIELENDFENIGDVRGLGLLIAIEIVKDKKSKIPDRETAQKIFDKCINERLLIHKSGRGDNITLQFSPPLITTKEHVDKAIKIIRKAFESVK